MSTDSQQMPTGQSPESLQSLVTNANTQGAIA
jgi:hypothetical protein